MSDLTKRLEKIEARIQLDRDALTEADNCAALAYYADILEALDAEEELAPQDAAIWTDITERRVDAIRAWKNVYGNQTV